VEEAYGTSRGGQIVVVAEGSSEMMWTSLESNLLQVAGADYLQRLEDDGRRCRIEDKVIG
jgi:hypothetical protein